MIDPIPNGVQGAQSTESGARSPQGEHVDPAGGAAFRALLEKLAQSARDLDSASSSIDDPRQLGRVVEDARASVQEAVLLGTDLLEAYRAAQARAAAPGPVS